MSSTRGDQPDDGMQFVLLSRNTPPASDPGIDSIEALHARVGGTPCPAWAAAV
ncbi:hypothetical protein NDY24_22330 [Xanthomonas hortorum pv. pelargonii]|nr:hypothetical protein NDY24_22330 [Xanthomonas hortorum pv. pelargonii]